MTVDTGNPRWPTGHQTVEEALAYGQPSDGLVHAALRETDADTLCERDGPRLTSSDHLRLNLDAPGTEALRHTVTCPGCIAWMRA